jgi:hypothetical protein
LWHFGVVQALVDAIGGAEFAVARHSCLVVAEVLSRASVGIRRQVAGAGVVEVMAAMIGHEDAELVEAMVHAFVGLYRADGVWFGRVFDSAGVWEALEAAAEGGDGHVAEIAEAALSELRGEEIV